MRREFREASDSKASPTVVWPAEEEEVQTQAAPRVRPEVAPLSMGVIVVVVIDLVLGLLGAMFASMFFLLFLETSPANLRGLGGQCLTMVGMWGAANRLLQRRRFAWVFQCLPATAELYLGVARYFDWISESAAIRSERFLVDWFFILGEPLVIVGLTAYVWWLTRRNGEG